MSDRDDAAEMLVTLTADIVAAHVGNNSVAISDLGLLIANVHAALSHLGEKPVVEEKPVPAVSIRASVKPDYIVCLEDGKKLKMLRRHLMTHYEMTPDDYRAKWGLPADYPMVAPNYAEKRRALAKHYFECFGKDFEEKYGAQLPVADFENTNWHLFQLVLPERMTRSHFMAQMMERNIGIGYHYAPIHLFKLYRERGFKEGMFPVAERVGRQIITLPMFFAMTQGDVERAVDAVKSVLQQ